MNKLSKRLLAMALSLTMVAGLVPAAFAAEGDATTTPTNPGTTTTEPAKATGEIGKVTYTEDVENGGKLTVALTELADGFTYTLNEVEVKNITDKAASVDVEVAGAGPAKLTLAAVAADAAEGTKATEVATKTVTLAKVIYEPGYTPAEDEEVELPEPVLVLAGEEYTVSTEKLTRAGYKFEGWGTADKAEEKITPKANVTLKGIWSELTAQWQFQKPLGTFEDTFTYEKDKDITAAVALTVAAPKGVEVEKVPDAVYSVAKGDKVLAVAEGKITIIGAGTTTLTATVEEVAEKVKETAYPITITVAKADRAAFTVSANKNGTEGNEVYVGDAIEVTLTDASVANEENVKYSVAFGTAGILKAGEVKDGKLPLTALKEGKTTVTVTAAETANFNAKAAEAFEVTVTKNAGEQTITVVNAKDEAVTALSATYGDTAKIVLKATAKGDAKDTTEGAAADATVAAGALTVKLDETEVSAEADGSYQLDVSTLDAGAHTVTITAAAVPGVYAAKTVPVTLTIKAVELAIKEVTVDAKTYDGTTDAVVTAVTLYKVGDETKAEVTATELKMDNYTVTAKFNSADVKTAEKVTGTVAFKDAIKNYELKDGSFEKAATITAKAWAFPTTPGFTAKAGETTTFDLNKLVDVKGTTFEVALKDGNDDILDAPTVKDGVLSVAVKAAATEGQTKSVTVTAKNDNYAATSNTFDVKVTATIKEVPVLNIHDVIVTYTGKDVEIPDDFSANMKGAFKWKGTAPKAAAAASYVTVVFTPQSTTAIEVEAQIKVTVNKAVPTGTPAFKTLETATGKTLADAKPADNTGLTPAEGTFAWDDGDSTAVEEGKAYAWTYTPTDSSNYEALKGTKVVFGSAKKPSGGSSYYPGGITSTTTDSTTGAVTETTTRPDGTKVSTTTEKDGTVTVAETYTDGTTVTTTAKDGAITSEVKVPASVDKVTVTIPTAEAAAPGMVAVLVKADGTEEIVKTSIPGETGVKLTLTEGAKLKLIDNSKDFADLAEDHWASASVDFVTAREIFNGTGDGNFSPAANATRASLMTVLARLNGVDTEGGETWFEKGMAWAVENGISDGSEPDANITREQLVTMLYRILGEPDVTGNLSAYNDAASVSEWANAAMSWAVSKGIVTGKEGSVLDPTGLATRAEVAAMLERYVKLTANV